MKPEKNSKKIAPIENVSNNGGNRPKSIEITLSQLRRMMIQSGYLKPRKTRIFKHSLKVRNRQRKNEK